MWGRLQYHLAGSPAGEIALEFQLGPGKIIQRVRKIHEARQPKDSAGHSRVTYHHVVVTARQEPV